MGIVCEADHLISCYIRDGPQIGSMGIPGEMSEMKNFNLHLLNKNLHFFYKKLRGLVKLSLYDPHLPTRSQVWQEAKSFMTD